MGTKRQLYLPITKQGSDLQGCFVGVRLKHTRETLSLETNKPSALLVLGQLV